jgi:hypothetical protein
MSKETSPKVIALENQKKILDEASKETKGLVFGCWTACRDEKARIEKVNAHNIHVEIWNLTATINSYVELPPRVTVGCPVPENGDNSKFENSIEYDTKIRELLYVRRKTSKFSREKKEVKAMKVENKRWLEFGELAIEALVESAKKAMNQKIIASTK